MRVFVLVLLAGVQEIKSLLIVICEGLLFAGLSPDKIFQVRVLFLISEEGKGGLPKPGT